MLRLEQPSGDKVAAYWHCHSGITCHSTITCHGDWVARMMFFSAPRTEFRVYSANIVTDILVSQSKVDLSVE